MAPLPKGMDLRKKLLAHCKAECAWYQPMDISPLGDGIRHGMPFHFGPAVFKMIASSRLRDLVKCLIGPEITLNPIQRVRIKPLARRLREDWARAHLGGTDWHQDKAIALKERDLTK